MPDRPPLRFAVLGAGFWARHQLAAWGEVSGAACVAVADVVRERAAALAAAVGGGLAVYRDAEELLARERVDFVDVIASPEAHRQLVELAARHRVAVICQKPLAPSLDDARAMADACAIAGVPLLVHENWRWQRPLRALHGLLVSGRIGEPFRARLDFVTSFPVFENQPVLAECERFILTDVGTHVLDTARFLFGEAQRLVATTRRVNPRIRGEDVATVLSVHGGCTVVTNLSYASRTAEESFPETFAFVEGPVGSAVLGPGGEIRVTTAVGTTREIAAPPVYAWADPAYGVVHASLVDCQRHLLAALRGEGVAETTAADNLKTLAMVEAAYTSAETKRIIDLS